MGKLFLIGCFMLVSVNSYGEFIVSAGGFGLYKTGSGFSEEKPGEYVNITQALVQKSPNTNSVTMWITRDWEEYWYDIKTTQKEIIDNGFTPVFIFYWFADEVSPQFIKDNKEGYFKTLRKFTEYLKRLDGEKIVILNPEYNMHGVAGWEPMNDIFLDSFTMLREDPQVLVGPCVGDFGNYDYVDEPQEWVLFDKSINRAAKEADFIAFQEMRALTRNSKGDMLRTPERAYNLSKFLFEKYNKPTVFAYAAISSYGENGEQIQKEVYKGFTKYIPKMQESSNLILFGTFHYFDFPNHVGFFKEAEEFFGIIRKDGSKKPAFKYYNMLK